MANGPAKYEQIQYITLDSIQIDIKTKEKAIYTFDYNVQKVQQIPLSVDK